ncbi:ABC transporter substrate-binding protein [Amphritea sp. 2_MG-2023]|uniref:ABC transporter substrate-binding protein n=1 Tax=Amphritea TaxID=515417 RepID=UPI001C06B7BE|nr:MULTISPECIES: ABC transporter substrate-binding protein [Amphritea]MBU2964152.1 ABC transporter substrate-binding protein [Amphritea atlantica]MDO6418551.1 ABC transporter substrate-binding protein [Amphritea sp. 2_MG-2023]
MKLIRKTLLASAMIVAASTAQASLSDDKVKIGVLVDMSAGYSDITGKGSVEAVMMAVEDFGGKVLGKPIEVVVGDTHLKADVGSSIARRWVEDEQVDVINGAVASSVTGAVTKFMTSQEKITLIAASASHTFTTKDCSPFNAHWTYDVVAVANGTVKPMVEGGSKKWFFITADYGFGHALEKVATVVIKSNGGEVVGGVRAPLGTTDFSSYILQAQSSGADVIALANAGADMINALKTAAEFGVTDTAEVAGLLVFTPGAQALDPAIAGGMKLTTGFYWDMDDQTRAWSKRYMARMDGKIPSMAHAGTYSSTMHYLKAVEATGTDEGKAVMAQMKATPVEDFFSRNGYLRKDGRMVHDMLQVRIKTASERKNENDIFVIEQIIKGDDAFMKIEDGGCEFALAK